MMHFPQAGPARRQVLLLGGLAAAGLLLAGCKEQGTQAAAPPPPVTVTAVTLEPQPVTLSTTLPGRTAAFQTAEIRPQVGGVIRERLFREGEVVSAGQPLFLIDPAPYRASLASAEASLARAEATLGSARVTVNRYRPLVAQNAVSRLDFETAVATQKQAEADVASGKAAVETAKINLAYTQVTSPIAGATSRSSVTVGALVTADQSAAMMTVTQLDPIYVDLTQPAGTVMRLRRAMEAGSLKRSGDAAEVRLLLEDGTEYSRPGTLQFAEVTVNANTGAVTLRAQFPNPDGLLMPGLFVRARLDQGVAQSALLVPQQAVTRNTRGEATALVIQADGTVQSRVLQTGQAIGNKWLVQGGLQAGDRVVVEGVQRIRPGDKPQVNGLTARQFDERVAAASAPQS